MVQHGEPRADDRTTDRRPRRAAAADHEAQAWSDATDCVHTSGDVVEDLPVMETIVEACLHRDRPTDRPADSPGSS